MMENWIEDYQEADLNEKYKILRDELTRLRGKAGRRDWFDRDDVAETIRELNEELEGQLIVFAANDFGLPVAFRPQTLEASIQNNIREALLERKYDQHEELNEIRQQLLNKHPAIHKAIVGEYDEGIVRYHLPKGSNTTTNFLTVREMVGLIDWTTNSFQQQGLSRTY